MQFTTPIRFPCSLPAKYDGDVCGENMQVVVNLISDADQTKVLLPLAARLVERMGKPTINDPRKIQRTTRDAVASLLQGIPGCRIPKALRHRAGAGSSPAALQAALALSSTVLARPVGHTAAMILRRSKTPQRSRIFCRNGPITTTI